MQDSGKKWLEKLLVGKKFKFLLIFLLLNTLGLCVYTVFYFLQVKSHPFFYPGVLTSYNQLKSAQTIDRQEVVNSRELIFAGDVMLSRHVQTLQEKQGSYLSAWENIYKEFSAADLVIINLESPFANIGPYPTEGMIFRTKPENIAGLNSAGIDVVHLANNHFGNAGQEGMEYTLKLLAENNISFVGAGLNKQEAYQGKIIEIEDWRVGFVGQSYDVPWYVAKDNNPGIAVYDLEKLEQAILELKLNQADFIVAMFHGGAEYTTQPTQEQINFAHAAISAGADVVIGHHPHWIQDAEEYQGKYIFYSLGNLIFDQNWSQETSQGLVVSLEIVDNKVTKVNLRPVIIEENFRPRFATLTESENILHNVKLPFAYELPVDN